MSYEDDEVVVKESPIEGLGVFAKRNFKKGDVIFTWHPESIVTPENRDSIPEYERGRYINILNDGTEVLMGTPERFVNHSCEPNTNAVNNADVAIRDIVMGEEITADYSKEHVRFTCGGCGAQSCKIQ